ncbi:outer membrane protein assembly factor BamA [Geomesophilobacter sediminis]|uniref:outer membrane protein assembly factor BamA n=1 Tax=Geomesophilobacter sediminis TaxID=2798584 RepID=UPI0038B26662
MLRIFVSALLALQLLFATAAFAEGDKIVAIKVKGNKRIESAAVMQVVKVRPGDEVDLDKVDADLRAIFKLGYFREVSAESDKTDGGITLTYVVLEKPVVREVKIEGAKEVSTDKVREALDVKANSIYSPKDVAKGVKKVKKLYSDEGYYLAEVETKVEKKNDTDLNLLVHIKEGDKILIEKIKFEGNHAFNDKKLKKQMETVERWWLSWLTGGGTYKEEVLKNDVALIADLYLNNGYVNVKVGEPKVELLPDKKGLTVTIGITEGDQYKLGALGFKGDLLESTEELSKKLKEKSGELFSRTNLRTDVFALTDEYADKGYAFANASPQTRIHPENKTIDITFEMEKGAKVNIDRINITGNTKSRDKVVRREMKLMEGDLYNATAIKKSKQNLMNTGFFEEANINTAKGTSPDKIDLNVDVKEKPTGTFSVGAGYSSLDGIIGQGSIQQSNFLGLGLKLSAAVSFGTKSQTYNLGVTDPYFMDTKWTLGGDVYRTERQYIDYTRRATGADIKAGYPLSDNVSTFWVYRYEEKEIFDESQGLLEGIHNGTIVAPETTSTTSSITASLSRNTTDYRLDPSNGTVSSLSVEFAGLGGSNRFVRSIADGIYFHPVGWGSVASIHGAFGMIQGVMGKDVQIDEKFYLGGIGTLRGFGNRTVSPSRSTETVVTDYRGVGTSTGGRVYLGGETEAYVNLEYTMPLVKEAGLKGVLFFDAGNAYPTLEKTFQSYDQNPASPAILASYGFGIRWFSPIGPLRLEYGIPVNPRKDIDHPGGRLEFSIGNFF